MHEEQPGSDSAAAEREQAAGEVTVNDRRRVTLDADQVVVKNIEMDDFGPDTNAHAKQIEQLETRASAAEQKLIEVQARFDQLRSQLQRETDEMRVRLTRSADERVRNAKIDFIASLLPVLDHLRLAVESAEHGSAAALLAGVKGTASGFESAVIAAGAEPLHAVGATFDPELHEAVDTVPVSADRDGIITAEYARGYKIGDRLLRPAKVQVGRSTENSTADSA